MTGSTEFEDPPRGIPIILKKAYVKYFMLYHIWDVHYSKERFLMFYQNLEDPEMVKNH